MNFPSAVYSHLKEYRGLIILLVLLSGVYASTLNTHGMFIWDEAEYASIARSVLEGDGFAINGSANSLRPPLLPLSGAAALVFTDGTSDLALKIPVLLFALLGLVTLFVAVKIEYGPRGALLSTAILGFAPSFWNFTSYYLSEIPFLAFFSTAVLFAHLGLYRDKKYFKYSWIGFGLAVLTRYTAVLFGPILLLMLGIALFDESDRTAIRARIFSRSFVGAPLIAFMIVAPWLLRQQLVFGDALVGFKLASGQLQAYMPGISMPWDFYLDRLPNMLTWPGAALLLLGLFWIFHSRDRLGRTCLLVSSFLLLWFSVYRYKEVRLITSILPFLAVPIALGSLRAFEKLLPKLDSRIWMLLVVASVGLCSFRTTRPLFENTVALGYPVLTRAAEFIRTSTPEDAVVMGAIGPQLSWYTHRKTRGIPSRVRLPKALEETDWVIFVNFERGQPEYVQALMKTLSQTDVDSGKLHIFNDSRYTALVFPSELLKNIL